MTAGLPDTESAPAPVVQGDREAAAFCAAHFWPGAAIVDVIRRGSNDDHWLVQAFARHRIASQAELLEACESAIPAGVSLTNRNIPDDFTVALDCTMGDLRKIAAAIAKVRGQ